MTVTADTKGVTATGSRLYGGGELGASGKDARFGVAIDEQPHQ